MSIKQKEPKVIGTYGKIAILDFGRCPCGMKGRYVVRDMDTGKNMEEFRRSVDAWAWARENG